MSRRTTTKRVLAIDPTNRGFGFAVLEGLEELIDWGIVSMRSGISRNRRDRIEALFERYCPDIVVTEDLRKSRRGPFARNVIQTAQRVAEAKGIRTKIVFQANVKSIFGGLNKHKVASLISQRFPEIAPRLPRMRKLWMSESEGMAVFDAVAFALTSLSKLPGR